MNRIAGTLVVVALAGAVAACGGGGAETGPARNDRPAGDAHPASPPAKPPVRDGEPKVEVLANGSGPAPRTGQMVLVHYVGTLLDGKKFDSSRDRGEPFKFALGTGSVIPGWDWTVSRMHVGDHWRVTIPYAMAYGERGMPPVIPPRSDLVFDMELVGIE